MGARSRPFECPKCETRFRSETVLKDHLKFECSTKTERIYCFECHRSYHSMSKYIEHFKKFQHQMNFAWKNKNHRCHREYVCFWKDQEKISFDYYYSKRPTDRRRWALKNSKRITNESFHTSLVFNTHFMGKPELPDNMMVRIPFPRIKNSNEKYPKWEAFKYQIYNGTLENVFAIYSNIMHTSDLTTTVCCSKIDKINSELPEPKYFCAAAMFPEPKKKQSKTNKVTQPVISSSDEESSEQEETSEQSDSADEKSPAHELEQGPNVSDKSSKQQQSWITECLSAETAKTEQSVFMIDPRVNQDLTKFEYVFMIVHAKRHVYLLVYYTSIKKVIVFDSFEDWIPEEDRTFHIKKIGSFIYKTQKSIKIKIVNKAKDLLPRAGNCNFYIYKFISDFINGSDPTSELDHEEMINIKNTYFLSALETTSIGRRLLSILDKYIHIKDANQY